MFNLLILNHLLIFSYSFIKASNSSDDSFISSDDSTLISKSKKRFPESNIELLSNDNPKKSKVNIQSSSLKVDQSTVLGKRKKIKNFQKKNKFKIYH